MKDHYKILGVREDASSEEIRNRYIKLAKLYHPDAKESDEHGDRIREINEAYEVLKDDSTRMDYDLRMSVKRAYDKERDKGKKRSWLMKGAVLSLSIIFFFSFLLLRKPSVDVERSSAVYHPISFLPTQTPEPEVRAKEVVSKGAPPVSQQKPSVAYVSTPPIPATKPEPPEPEARVKEVVSKTSPVPTQEEPRGAQINSTATAQVSEKIADSKPATQIEKLTLIPKEEPKSDPVVLKESKKEIALEPPKPVLPLPASKPTPLPVSRVEPMVTAISPSPPTLVEDEVRQFLTDYIDRYIRKDIQGFLALFSPKAIQNGKDGFEKIRDIYLRFFEQSERLFYRLEDVKIAIDGSNAEVRGRYQVTQKLKNQQAEKLWRGNLRWELVKKDGALKIAALDYQHEKSL